MRYRVEKHGAMLGIYEAPDANAALELAAQEAGFDDFIEGCVEGWGEGVRAQLLPPLKDKSVTFRMREDEYDRLRQNAAKLGMRISAFIRDAVLRTLEPKSE